MSARKLPNWYWQLLGIWAVTLAAALLVLGWYIPIIWLVGAIVIMPLVGVPALLLVLAPLLSLPFALRRPKLSTE